MPLGRRARVVAASARAHWRVTRVDDYTKRCPFECPYIHSRGPIGDSRAQKGPLNRVGPIGDSRARTPPSSRRPS